MPRLARIVGPLNKKLEKGEADHFGVLKDEEYQPIQKLWDRLLSTPILALHVLGRPYILDTDICNVPVGCTLLQEQADGRKYKPNGYWSRYLTRDERKYTITEKERLAVV